MKPPGRSVAAPLLKLMIVGVVSLAGLAAMVVTYGNFPLTPTNTYRAIFTDATGSMVGDDVRIAGVPVGRVTGVDVKDNTLAEVTFTVERSWPLMTSTRAALRYRNLIGQRYLSLSEGPGGTESLRPGGTIPLTQTEPALDLTVVFNGLKPVFSALAPADANRLVSSLVKVMQGEGGTFTSLLTQAASLTTALAGRDQVIARLVDNLGAVMATVDSRNRQVTDMVTQLQRLVSTFARDRSTIGATLVDLNGVLGVASGLLTEGRAPLTSIIGGLGPLTERLVANGDVLNALLQTLPPTLDALVRVSSYGSWGNVRLCELTIISDILPVAIPTIQLPTRGCER